MLKQLKKRMKDKTLFDLLEEISVQWPGQWENETGTKFWYAVATDEGIVAYFGTENEAFKYRLDLINRILND